ncbi:hypothetical protein DNU06_12575 [Putridiphycobacter roseus]|uniref:DUF4292 domain-containing protein n=1 Tax=Putridiphycobacter roseus TaxID=2219161 RepID=A0A2W1NC74_9FLAO|nr:DUF4292 domain-containing protein [Putridiphycobacter roseus]PZE16683.1 hypothetical protein DNU06_12575 [Putridiphycobacter roseus]
MNSRLNIIYLICSLFILFSCGNDKNLKLVDIKVNDKELSEHLLELNKHDFDFFYSKIYVDYKSSSVNQSFKSSLKMTVDSAFSGTISYASFIIANFIASQDSIKAVYKQNKCYFTENFSYISSIIGVELEYEFLQSMLLGKPIGVDSTVKYKQIKEKDKAFHILASHKKRIYKKIEKEKMDVDNEKLDDIFIKYYFSASSLALKKIIFEVPSDSVSIAINYVESIVEADYLLPDYTTLVISMPKDTLSIGLSYSKQSVNNRRDHIFSVPDHYENCNQ